ncbi:hypothetical protein V500_05851, partial [Pseudogymnoascus sp. VKM F-4518 (FW-2643)]
LEEGLVERVVESDEDDDDINNLDWEPDCSLDYRSDGGLIDGSVEPDDDSGQELDAESDAKLGRGLLLSERLFQLSCAFWTNILTTGVTSHLPLVYFFSVLGIQRKDLVFRTAYHYTPYLAGLVYVGRLLMLEYALPRQAYETLSWPDCSACPNQLQLMRKKYLCRGGGHPMARLLELLYQDRTIAKKEGARANISWSANGQILQLCLGFGPSQRQYHIDVSQFRAMVWITIQDCQNLLQELIFGWRPAVDLNADLSSKAPAVLRRSASDAAAPVTDAEFLTSLGFIVMDDPEGFLAITNNTLVFSVAGYLDMDWVICQGPWTAALICGDIEDFMKKVEESARNSSQNMVCPTKGEQEEIFQMLSGCDISSLVPNGDSLPGWDSISHQGFYWRKKA